MLRWYRPFDEYPRLLMDYLRLASEINDVNPFSLRPSKHSAGEHEEYSRIGVEEWNFGARRILEFVRRYGQLGVLWECVNSFDLANKTVLIEPSLSVNFALPEHLRSGTISFDEFIANFHDAAPQIESVCANDPKFLGEYSEPLKPIFRDVSDLHRMESDWQLFSNRPTPRPKATWGDLGRPSAKVTLTVNVDDNGQPRLDYYFTSLISALRAMLTVNSASHIGSVRICALAECNEPFVAKNDRGRYCCESHSNRDRQRSFVNRKSKTQKGKKNGRSSSRKTKR